VLSSEGYARDGINARSSRSFFICQSFSLEFYQEL
jgi:hypothetical protein